MATDPRSRTRNKQVRRIIKIIAMMQRGYWSYSALSGRLSVSQRTIERDFAAIRYDGVALRHDGVKTCWTLKGRR